MSRLQDVLPSEMSDEQRRIADEIASSRGGVVRGPFAMWIRNPDLANRANQFGSLLRDGTSVPRRLSELAILITARHWTAQYEWYAHRPQAEAAGLKADVVDAIAERRRPAFNDADDELVYEVCIELHDSRKIDDGTYARAVERFGEMTVIELISIVGFYTLVAMMLVAFEAPLPEGAVPPLAS